MEREGRRRSRQRKSWLPKQFTLSFLYFVLLVLHEQGVVLFPLFQRAKKRRGGEERSRGFPSHKASSGFVSVVPARVAVQSLLIPLPTTPVPAYFPRSHVLTHLSQSDLFVCKVTPFVSRSKFD